MRCGRNTYGSHNCAGRITEERKRERSEDDDDGGGGKTGRKSWKGEYEDEGKIRVEVEGDDN
jgi:hypothetical protein